MSDVNQSASASAEANGIKVSGNTVNFSLPTLDRAGKPGMLERLVRLINPTRYETNEAEARKIKAQSLISTAKLFQAEFPIMSERRAFLEAMGYRITNEQADNVVEILEGAANLIDSEGFTSMPLKPQIRDAIMEGAKGAYDEDIRNLWKKLIAGESKSPGNFSKRSISILSNMSTADAVSFKTLCSFCVIPDWYLLDKYLGARPIPLLVVEVPNGPRINEEAFTYLEQSNLESMGLIDTSISSRPTIESGSWLALLAGKRTVVVCNESDRDRKINLGPVLTNPARELATLCWDSVGTYNNLPSLIEKLAKKSGMVVQPLDRVLKRYDDEKD